MNRRTETILSLIVISMLIIVTSCKSKEESTEAGLRLALFNIWELSTEKLQALDSSGQHYHEQLQAAATIIQRIDPDILVINEIDHDLKAVKEGLPLELNASRFNDHYLSKKNSPSPYRYIFIAPCNTGILAGKDFDNNGVIATPEDLGTRIHGGDCFGYGSYPGQYSMAILSKHPFDSAAVRTFQKFLWKDLPENMIPEGWYSEDELEIFRLSSKSHWDVPFKIGDETVHLLISHPTPPVFDGPEDRNGRRNHDELKMWVHYIDNDDVMVDDNGLRGGLAAGESFIICGDLNAAPRGDTLHTGNRSIDQLLNHPKIQDTGEILISEGALGEDMEPGPPDFLERRTIGWHGRGLRIDYLLPSTDIQVVDGAVFWPDSSADPEGSTLAKQASDHRLIWLDIKL